MIEQVKEIGAESHVLSFTELERLIQREIHILLRRADDAVARRVAVDRRVTWRAVGKRWGQWIWCVRRRVHPVGQPRFRAAVAGRISTAEARSERRGGRRCARQRVSCAAGRVVNRDWGSRLQDDYAAGFPATERCFCSTTRVGEEGQLINRTCHEALPPVEVGKAAGSARVVLVVHPRQEGHGSRRNIVNGLRPGVRALKIKPMAEVVGQSRLQRAVMRIGVGREVLEVSGSDTDVGRAERSVLRGGIGDCAGKSLGLNIGAALSGNDNRILRAGQRGLVGIIG